MIKSVFADGCSAKERNFCKNCNTEIWVDISKPLIDVNLQKSGDYKIPDK